MSRGILLMLIFLSLLMHGSRVEAQPPKELTNSIGMKLVLIPKGRFLMGSPGTETDRDKDELQHEVTISRDYYLGAYEVTQGQYEKVMGENPSYFQGAKVAGDSTNHPVETVSWEDAVEFCRRLSLLPEEKASGRGYRLPTEAEWEYACRAGSKAAYSFGDDNKKLKDYCWYGDNSGRDFVNSKELWLQLGKDGRAYLKSLLANGNRTHVVGEKKPNAWGLYDLHGNVWEWCQDWYGEYAAEPTADPTGPSKGSDRVRRGGGWGNVAAFCRSASRLELDPTSRGNFLGFRLALSSLESESASRNGNKNQ
jgi:formylglycine-generating enzyme required for sulfatase activity